MSFNDAWGRRVPMRPLALIVELWSVLRLRWFSVEKSAYAGFDRFDKFARFEDRPNIIPSWRKLWRLEGIKPIKPIKLINNE
jgi:hypothetical protein